MDVGDLVMYTDEENYAEWFFGRLARVKNYSIGLLRTTYSDFACSAFEVIRAAG